MYELVGDLKSSQKHAGYNAGLRVGSQGRCGYEPEARGSSIHKWGSGMLDYVTILECSQEYSRGFLSHHCPSHIPDWRQRKVNILSTGHKAALTVL